ncbi:MAG: AAA family ATPase [Acidaminococcaceae bacterium]
MRISKMHLKNFRCFENFMIEFEDDLTVIVAENGRGKSAILDAVAVAIGPYIGCFNGVKTYNFLDNDVMQIQENNTGKKLRIQRMKRQFPVLVEAEGFLNGKNVSWQREKVRDGSRTTIKNAKSLTDYGRKMQKAIHGEHDEKIILPVIAYYGTTRMWEDAKILAGNRQKLNLERDSGYFEAMEPSATYQTFGHWFQYAALSAMEFDCYLKERNSNEKNPYREVLRSVSRAIDIAVGNMGWKNIDYSVSLQSLVISHDKIGTLPVSALSDGIRSVISMVADIAYRMVRLNPDLGEEATRKTSGIVLIDEVDMHLHPSWQQTVVSDLRKAFPMVQFIITTHSPQVLTTVPARSIRALRWDDGHVEIYSPEFSLGAESYQLLKEIQNVDTRPQALPIVKTLMRYLELVSDDQWDSEEAVVLRKELDEWGKNREPALIKADMDIKMRAYRRKKK